MKRGQNQKRERRPQDGRRPAGSPATSAAPLTPGRKWLFRLLAICIPLLVVFGGLELLLRAVGYGFDPHFFKKTRIGDRDCYVSNEDFGLRFFPRSMVRFPPPVVMPATKAPDTFRIFIFGESAALGDPRPNYGAGGYLEVLLAERFPQAKFEIINTSVTAINSHAILPIAKECAGHAGDLWIIYIGNNEMVGPFGAATVFGARAPPLWLARAQLQLRRLRLGQLLFAASEKFHKANSRAAAWGGMEMFMQNQIAPGDPRRQTVYRNFELNLNGILNAGLASGSRIILSTVAVNLKDCPPFGSAPPPVNATAYEQLCQDGAAAETQGEFAQARSDYENATGIWPQSAETQFQLATCLLRLTNAAMARPHFLQAVDADALPFRTDSRINGIIRTAAGRFAGEPVVLCDAAETLSTASPEGIPGEDLFYEHVHLSPNGNYALALAWAKQVDSLLNPALKRDARPSWVSQAECEQLLGLTDWNRLSILEEILQRIQRPPFFGQSGNAQQVARFRIKIVEMRRRLTDELATQAQQVYLRALRRAPENYHLHENYAEFLEARRELPAAIAERRKICELLPFFYFPCYALGSDLKDTGALPEAREIFLKANALNPHEGEVLLELGTVFARQGQWEAAQRELEAARRYSPDDPKIPLFLGEVLWKLDRRNEALASLRDAIRLDPSDWQPHYRLASDLAQEGHFSEAATEYQEALRLEPANSKAKLGLATALVNLGRAPEASQQLDAVLQLEPTNRTALEMRQRIRGRESR